MDTIGSLADVRPGDIGVMKMGGLVPGLLPVAAGMLLCGDAFRLGRRRADHVLICVEAQGAGLEYFSGPSAPRAVQAMPRGAEEIALTPARHWTDTVTWFRLPEDYTGQAGDAAAIARLFVAEKIPYSFLSYVALAAWARGLKAERLEKWIDRHGEQVSYPTQHGPSFPVHLPKEAICSVLVDQAWTLAGKRVMNGVQRQCVTPGAMMGQLYSRRGVIRGGPGLLS